MQKEYDFQTLHKILNFFVKFIKTASPWNYSMPAVIYVEFNFHKSLQLTCEQLNYTVTV